MTRLPALFDLVLIAAFLFSVVVLLAGWRRRFRRGTKLLLAALSLFVITYGFCMAMEWFGVTTALESLEDLTGALVPMWWAFVFYALVQEVTDRELRRSEARYRAFIANSLEGICRFEVSPAMPTDLTIDEQVEWLLGKATVAECNEVFRQMYGFSADDEIIGTGLRGLWGEDIELGKAILRVFVKADYRFDQFEALEQTKNGQYKWLLKSGFGIIEDDHLAVMWSLQVDVTERRRAEQELMSANQQLQASEQQLRASNLQLSRSEQRYRAMVDDQTELICRITPDLVLTFVNRAYCKYYGKSADELVGRSFLPDIPEELHGQIRAYFASFSKDKPLATHEHRVILPDGRVRWQQWTYRAILDDAGNVVEFQGVGRDITQRKEAQQALQESVAKYRALFEGAGDAILTLEVTESGLFFLDCNSTTLEMFGCRREDIVGKSPLDFSPPTQPDGEASEPKALRVCKAAMTGKAQRFEWVHHRLDGSSFEAEVSLNRVTTGGKTYLQAIVRDVTQRKQLEERERRHQAQLAHVSRLSMAGELASGVAHELNQPLTAIATYAQSCRRMIDAGKADSPEVRAAAEQIVAQALRGGEIIRRMRDFVRKQEQTRVQDDLNQIVEEAVGLVSAQARDRDITVQLELAEGPLMVVADRIQIQQVIVNLIQNGFDAMSEAERCDRVLTVRTARTDGNSAEVAVADRGSGMTEENLEKLFDPFFTTKPQGLGIGLSISHSIIEEHEGRIWAAVNRDKGMTFRFTLPLESPASVPRSLQGS